MIDLNRFRLSLLCLCLCLAASLFPEVLRADADRIYRDNSPAVVVVVAIGREGKATSLGSGFIVREDGAVVTNYHVINMASDIKVKMGYKVLDVEGILHVDPENDLAILKLKGHDFPVVRLGDANSLAVGEKVYVIGSPQGLENTISEGILSGIRKVDKEHKVLQMTAAISPGSSGGPLFNDRGEVVGIATFLIADTQNLNFAMPINLITPGLQKKELVSPAEACQADYTETASCWFYQGLAYGTSGQYARAADAFKRSLTIDPGKAESYVNLGVSYANMGKYQLAAEMFSEALKITPDHPEALVRLGLAYTELGRSADALAVLERATKLRPDSGETFYHLALTYGVLNQPAEAMAAAKEATRLSPKLAGAHGYLGSLYRKMKMYREATAEFKIAIRLEPDDPMMHLGLGRVYVAMDEKASALDEYKILKRLSPTLADQLFDEIYK